VDGLIMSKIDPISASVLVTSNPGGEFEGHFRLGQFWPRAGRVVAQDAFTADEWAVLTADTRLHIGPAPDEAEVEAEAKAQSLKDQIVAVLGTLEPGDFEADGTPKLGAVRERLPGQARKITARLVAEVWAGLKPAV
jgi:hypothetical protein